MDYKELLAEIKDVLGEEKPLERVVEVLFRVPHYSWVGIYLVRDGELVLGPWRGREATQHVRIPMGRGICGAAAASGKTEVVADVSADPRYLACFPSTRAEIVVPILAGDRVLGEIDIDSDVPAAFTQEDKVFLEQVAKLLVLHIREET